MYGFFEPRYGVFVFPTFKAASATFLQDLRIHVLNLVWFFNEGKLDHVGDLLDK